MRPTPSFFEGVSDDLLDAASARLERRLFPAGSLILAEGDRRSEMYVLASGCAEALLVDRQGVERVVSAIGAGETIGEMSLLTGSPASATVRAVEDVELLVLREGDLGALEDEIPELRRNLITTLAARLARVTRLAVQEEPGRVIALEDGGGPDVLGYALAASIAWHCRAPTVLVVLGKQPSPRLSGLATLGPKPPFRGMQGPGADLLVSADLEDSFGPQLFASTLEELTRAFDYVLVQVPQTWAGPPIGFPRVRLGAFDSPDGGLAVDPESGAASSGREQFVRMPPFTPADFRSLEQGLLPAGTAAGAAVAKIARELTKLRVGVALGAGSMRGYAHIGALHALERLGVPIDCLAGTSIGATVAALYAHFGEVDRVAELLDGIGARMFRPTLSRRSLLSTRAMRRYTRRVVGDPLLEELAIPVGLVATDVDTQDEVVLRRGSSVAATFASTAIPGVFPAVRIGNRTLVDGGIVNPVPVNVAAGIGADVVIGIQLVRSDGVQTDELSEEGQGPVPSAVAAIMRSIELLQTRIGIDSGSVTSILVTPEFGSLPAGKLRNFREGRRYIAAGEAAIDEALPQLQASLPWLRPIGAQQPVVHHAVPS